MTVTECADHLGRCSILLMWAALIIRARPALLNGHYQRGLWLAIASAAIATTLFQPDIINSVTDVTGDPHALTLSRNIAGVLAAGLTLLFIIDSTHPRRLRLIITAAVVGVVMTLLGMDLVSDDPGPSIPPAGGPAEPSSAYWLTVCAAHLAADTVTVLICGQYSRRTHDRDLAWSLRLFAIGSILALAYWVGFLTHLYVRIPDALPLLSVIINLHGVARAFTLLVPTATSAARLARDGRTVWVLWPMWRQMCAAVPNVALAQPQPTRLHQLLRSRAPLALQAHRQIIETYDAILHLQPHLPPKAYEQALTHVKTLQVPAPRRKAAALAGALGQARRAKLTGQTPTGPQPLPGLDQGDVTLLLAMARHWPTMTRAAPDPEPTSTTP